MSKQRIKVLVVDDSDFIRNAVEAMLSDHDMDVIGLDSPTGFGRVMMLDKPDVVLMDVSMPALSGDRLVEMATRSGLHRCPILLFSDRSDAELAALAKQCGAAGYIRKTKDASLLALLIRRYLGGFKQEANS